MSRQLGLILAGVLAASIATFVAQDRRYDPLAVSSDRKAEALDLTIVDPARRREIPSRVYLPATTAAAPVVLFSHGLGGSREGYADLGQHWAVRVLGCLAARGSGRKSLAQRRRATVGDGSERPVGEEVNCGLRYTGDIPPCPRDLRPLPRTAVNACHWTPKAAPR